MSQLGVALFPSFQHFFIKVRNVSLLQIDMLLKDPHCHKIPLS